MRPAEYLSYSQYSTFLRSKQEYIDSYVNGIKRQNKYMDFGKLIACGLEDIHSDACGDIKIARSVIKEPVEKEKKIKRTCWQVDEPKRRGSVCYRHCK